VKKTRRPPLLLALLLLALLILPFAACQSSSGGQVLNLWDTGPLTLDPAIAADVSSYVYVMQIFSGLIGLNQTLDVVPDIAESWDVSSDNTTYTFHLRHGVRFQNGGEVTAADFKYSWERACDPATGSGTAATYLGDIVGAKDMLAGTVTRISGVVVVDDYTLQVTIDAPVTYFLDKLAYPTAFVVDKDDVESGANWWLQPDGTGPFKLKEWTPGQQLVLERNQNYYGEQAKLAQVVFHFSAVEPMALYETGQIDVALVSTSYIDEATDESGPFQDQLSVTPELSLYYIGFNTAEPPFDDVNVRQAFCLAVDKEHIAKVILRDMVGVAEGILPPGMPGYNDGLQGLNYNVERARELIAASKYGDVSNLPPIALTVDGYGNNIPSYLGAVIQDWQQNLGVEVLVRQLEPEDFLYSLNDEKDEMFALGWIADYPDPNDFLDVLFHTGMENDMFEYSNPSLDALLDQAAVEHDTAIRLAMYQQAEQIVVDDAPCLPLFHGTNYILVEPYVKDYYLSSLGIPDLSRVYIEEP
jgi:oligopeptide transport system substrate-binding protein